MVVFMCMKKNFSFADQYCPISKRKDTGNLNIARS
jgi:hypothetical protein